MNLDKYYTDYKYRRNIETAKRTVLLAISDYNERKSDGCSDDTLKFMKKLITQHEMELDRLRREHSKALLTKSSDKENYQVKFNIVDKAGNITAIVQPPACSANNVVEAIMDVWIDMSFEELGKNKGRHATLDGMIIEGEDATYEIIKQNKEEQQKET